MPIGNESSLLSLHCTFGGTQEIMSLNNKQDVFILWFLYNKARLIYLLQQVKINCVVFHMIVWVMFVHFNYSLSCSQVIIGSYD